MGVVFSTIACVGISAVLQAALLYVYWLVLYGLWSALRLAVSPVVLPVVLPVLIAIW